MVLEGWGVSVGIVAFDGVEKTGRIQTVGLLLPRVSKLWDTSWLDQARLWVHWRLIWW